jgi:hypothetical protein
MAKAKENKKDRQQPVAVYIKSLPRPAQRTTLQFYQSNPSSAPSLG